MATHEFVAPVDFDEVISPQADGTLQDMVARIKTSVLDADKVGSIFFQQTFFFSEFFPRPLSKDEAVPRYSF